MRRLALPAVYGLFAAGVLALWYVWATRLEAITELLGARRSGLQDLGQWGDSFGGLNVLFGALGFLTLSATLLLQMRSLKQQQEDQYRQRFESSFFELLKLLRECREQVSVESRNGKNIGGLEAFQYAKDFVMTQASFAKEDTDRYCSVYGQTIHASSEVSLSPYFRVIYRILDRLRDDRILTNAEKISYAKLLRGQLSSSELTVLGLNAKMPAAKDMSNLLADFRMLKYLPPGPIRDELKRIYPPETFKGHGDP